MSGKLIRKALFIDGAWAAPAGADPQRPDPDQQWGA